MATAHSRACPQGSRRRLRFPWKSDCQRRPGPEAPRRTHPHSPFLQTGQLGLSHTLLPAKRPQGAKGRANKEESAFVPSTPPRVK